MEKEIEYYKRQARKLNKGMLDAERRFNQAIQDRVSKEEMFEFIEWVGENFIRINRGWICNDTAIKRKMIRYTTEELYETFKK